MTGPGPGLLRIASLDAANPGPMTGSGNWTYLIEGAVPTLIDAGVGRESHLDAIAAAMPAGPSRVLVTHAHSDHASGAPALQSRWPSARFAKWPWPERDARYDVGWIALADGDRVPAGDDVLEIVHTPGHSPDHVTFWHASSRTAFTGDLVVVGTSVVIPASNGGSLREYLRSLARIQSLDPARLLPAHGPAVEDPADVLARYVAHRLHREQQVLSALGDGVHSVDRIAERIYGDMISPALAPMTRESVLAHLRKLEEDGLAVTRADGWFLAD